MLRYSVSICLAHAFSIKAGIEQLVSSLGYIFLLSPLKVDRVMLMIAKGKTKPSALCVSPEVELLPLISSNQFLLKTK